MVKIEEVRVLSIQLQDEDVDNFISIMTKLLMETKKPGFRKYLTDDESATLNEIAEGIGLEVKVTPTNIIAGTTS
jgi:hypothetical protein